MIHLARILVYPIKSFEGTSLQRATLLRSGAIQHDRQYAVRDSDGRFVNAKRTPKIHRLDSRVDLSDGTVALRAVGSDEKVSFQLDQQRQELNDWLSRFFELPVQLAEDRTVGFPDDPEATGPTVVSQASLSAVAGWFSDMAVDECRERFRANLEIGGTEPFWEDRLFGEAGSVIRFQIGDVVLEGVNPCQRCVVPTRSPRTGEAIGGFQKVFAQRRKETLPARVAHSRFDHYYRFSVNTRVPPSEAGKLLCVGDPVRVLTS